MRTSAKWVGWMVLAAMTGCVGAAAERGGGEALSVVPNDKNYALSLGIEGSSLGVYGPYATDISGLIRDVARAEVNSTDTITMPVGTSTFVVKDVFSCVERVGRRPQCDFPVNGTSREVDGTVRFGGRAAAVLWGYLDSMFARTDGRSPYSRTSTVAPGYRREFLECMRMDETMTGPVECSFEPWIGASGGKAPVDREGAAYYRGPASTTSIAPILVSGSAARDLRALLASDSTASSAGWRPYSFTTDVDGSQVDVVGDFACSAETDDSRCSFSAFSADRGNDLVFMGRPASILSPLVGSLGQPVTVQGDTRNGHVYQSVTCWESHNVNVIPGHYQSEEWTKLCSIAASPAAAAAN